MNCIMKRKKQELLHYRHAIFSLCQAQENNCIESAPVIFFGFSIYIGLVILIYNQFMGILLSLFLFQCGVFLFICEFFFCLMEHFSFCSYICIICNNVEKVKRYHKLIHSQIFFLKKYFIAKAAQHYYTFYTFKCLNAEI